MKTRKIDLSVLPLVILTVIVFVVFSIANSSMLTIFNLKSILIAASVVAIAAVGMTFAMTAGVFDMSIGSIEALVSVLVAKYCLQFGLVPALIISFIAAAVAGYINGIIVTKLKIEAFAATLVTQLVIRGIALLICDNKEIGLFSAPEIKFFSTKAFLGVPIPVVFTVVLFVLGLFLYYRTGFGLKIRSVGSNAAASKISGIKTDKVLISVFVWTAITTALAAVIVTAQVGFGQGTIGIDYALEVITAVVMGGTLMAGGKGNLVGTMIAAVLIAAIKNGLNLCGFDSFWQRLFIGIVFIGAMVINSLREAKAQRMAI